MNERVCMYTIVFYCSVFGRLNGCQSRQRPVTPGAVPVDAAVQTVENESVDTRYIVININKRSSAHMIASRTTAAAAEITAARK